MPTGILAYNPAAGRFPSRLLAGRAAKVLRASGWDISVKQSSNGAHITRLARQAAEDHLDAMFMAGGDGSINRAVAGLAGSETALGVLPAGTSNVFAQELGLPCGCAGLPG
jgi:diacylglycerol kinase (ATP)